MFELKICIICLKNNVRLHKISGSIVQDVFEKLTNKVQEDGYQYFACYICYHQLKNCQQLAIKSQKSEELLKQILPLSSEFHLRPISFLDRLTHGLVHSLMVSNTQSLQIPEYNEFIITEKQDESDTNGEIVGGGSDVEFGQDAQSPKKVKLDENNKNKHSDINSIENGQKENLSLNVTNKKSKQVLGKKTFICNDCGKTCKTKAVLIKHISGHKPVNIKPNETNIKNTKSLCENKYKSEIKEKNSSNKNLCYKCEYCNYTCTQNSHLKSHIRTHTGEKPYKCQYCSYKCTQNSDLKRHIRTHTGEKPFICHYCSYKCAQNGDLKNHIRSHTGEKPFKCQYCSYKCTVSSILKRHIRTHTGEKPFKCQYCSFTCTHGGHLKSHIKTHTGEKPFKCQYCNYKCTRNSILKNHIKTHTGEKPFKCQYCNYICAQRGPLKSHIRTHTGEKPFQCQYCSYKCAFNSNLKIHIRTHTGEKPFKCQYCSYTCAQNNNLKKHIRIHTGENS